MVGRPLGPGELTARPGAAARYATHQWGGSPGRPAGKTEAHHRGNGDGLRVALRVEGRGRTIAPEFTCSGPAYAGPPACAALGRFRSSCPPALTRKVVSMPKDTEPDRRRQVPWLGIASLLVTLVRLLHDLWRKGQ
ncbi:hypothetical protein GCM10009706_27290 [Curtobacterium citreum]|nr:hypothetical protein GCM10009706_27290 [Curtobacterium citreum]